MIAYRVVLVSLALGVLGAAGGCAAPCADPHLKAELYLGRDGAAGDADAFAAFIADSAVDLDGYTLLDAAGGWRAAPGAPLQAEPASVLIVIVPRTAAQDAGIALDRIAARYLERFGQQAVMRVDQPACVTIYRPVD